MPVTKGVIQKLGSRVNLILAMLLLFSINASACTSPKAKENNTAMDKKDKKTVLILGAAGQVGKMLTDDLLEQTDHNIVLYARNANERLKAKDPNRVKIFDGDFKDAEALSKAMKGVDIVYLNDTGDPEGVATIVNTMKEHKVKRIIVATVLDIYNEVNTPFGEWNRRMRSEERFQKGHLVSVSHLEVPELDYTLLRLTWLYNKEGNRNYMITQKGEPFKGAQVTRQAVSQLVTDIIKEPTDKFIKTSLGVSEPNTDWDKPSFY
ncbi:NAD(P)H-binding protein [Chryseobacterium koreense]